MKSNSIRVLLIIIICILIAALLTYTFYIIRALPKEIGLNEFVNAVAEVELKQKTFVEVDTNIFFYKSSKFREVQDTLKDNSIAFVEQMGAAAVFEVAGVKRPARIQAVTRRYNLLIIDTNSEA